MTLKAPLPEPILRGNYTRIIKIAVYFIALFLKHHPNVLILNIFANAKARNALIIF